MAENNNRAVAVIDPWAEKQKDIALAVGKYRGRIENMLAEKISPDQFLSFAMTAMMRNSEIAECSTLSIVNSLLVASMAGLKVDGRQGHIIARKIWNKKTGQTTMEAQFQPDYKGKIDLLWETGLVREIFDSVVYENEPFKFVVMPERTIEHQPLPPSLRGEKIIGAYAVIVKTDGQRLWHFMWNEDIQKRRDVSRAKDNGPWVNWYEEMAAKTVWHSFLKKIKLMSGADEKIQAATQAEDLILADRSQNLLEPTGDEDRDGADERPAVAFESQTLKIEHVEPPKPPAKPNKPEPPATKTEPLTAPAMATTDPPAGMEFKTSSPTNPQPIAKPPAPPAEPPAVQKTPAEIQAAEILAACEAKAAEEAVRKSKALEATFILFNGDKRKTLEFSSKVLGRPLGNSRSITADEAERLLIAAEKETGKFVDPAASATAETQPAEKPAAAPAEQVQEQPAAETTKAEPPATDPASGPMTAAELLASGAWIPKCEKCGCSEIGSGKLTVHVEKGLPPDCAIVQCKPCNHTVRMKGLK